MGQYFQLVNEDRKEMAQLPGGMKAVERVSNTVAMGLLGYLLLDGPQDGTSFSYRNNDPDDVDKDDVEAWIDRETASEVESDRESVYRADDGSWDRAKIRRVVAAGYEISEANEFAGRWAGDRVRLVGDYAENDLYSAPEGRIVAQLNSGEMVSWEGWHPSRVEPAGRSPAGGQSIRHFDEDAEPGDTIQIPSTVESDEQFAEFVRYESNEWTILGEELHREFAEFMGQEWLEANGYADFGD